jgi:hypothetical protein
MYQAGFRNLVVAPFQYREHRDQKLSESYACGVAREAVDRMCSTNPGLGADYLAGFEQGVIDFITYGGDQLPPILPPRQYWQLEYRAGDLQDAGQQWLQGCEAGRQYAETTGLRGLQPVRVNPPLLRPIDYPTSDSSLVDPPLQHPSLSESPVPAKSDAFTTPAIEVSLQPIPLPEAPTSSSTPETASDHVP